MTERDIFIAALQKEDPAERRAYLDEACAGQPELRAQVEDLLRLNAGAGSFLEQRAPDAVATGSFPKPTATAPSEVPGSMIGPYMLIERIGEGGMGTVWMAQQTEPVRRVVALKVIRAGLDSRQVVARFEAERQALALMDHVNIARVFDGGETPPANAGGSPRPYFVMELVKGQPITKYCDEHHLTPRQRLELFVPVCQAIQHAHQKGIIHRDIKPNNVLVALYDGRPVPKVIDFGVAKAAAQQLTEETLVTGFGAIIGTPEYMSPEQADVSQLDVDTRSDIYSLGVLLYELLTGSPPFSRKELEQAGMMEMLRVIREQEPSKPSTKLSSAEGLPALAANRGMEPAKLTKLVRGELDWIVMKCLEKDRDRRYESANGFALDVQRYLADEAVLACPPSVAYRLRKFARRNKGPVLATSLVLLALVGGIVGTSIGLVRAAQRAVGEKQAKDTAEKRLAQVERGIELLGSLFEHLDPWAEEKEGRPLRMILVDRLDKAADELDGDAVSDPLVVARLQDRIGLTYLGLGHAKRAETLFAKAVATRQAHLGTNAPLTLTSRHNHAVALEAAGKRIEAIKQFEQVDEARVTILGTDHLDTLSTRNELAVCYYRAGRLTDAMKLLEQVRSGRETQLGGDDDLTLDALQNLVPVYSDADKHEAAIALAEKVRDLQVKKRGEYHPRAIDAMSSLAWACCCGYKMRQADALFNQAEKTIVPKLGPNHPQTLSILHGVAQMHFAYRRMPQAIALFEQVREKRLLILGESHPSTLRTTHSLGLAHLIAGDRNKALPLFQQAAAGVEKLAYAYDEANQFIHNLCDCLEQLDHFDQAEVWRRKWVATAKDKYGPESLRYAGRSGLTGLGENLLHQKKYADAEPILRASLAILEKKEPRAWETFRTQSMFGAALLGQQNYAEAELHLVPSYQGLKKTERSRGTRHHGTTPRQRTLEALDRVVQLYESWDKPDDAAKWRKELEVLKKDAEQEPKDK